jgi:hypothetical protein
VTAIQGTITFEARLECRDCTNVLTEDVAFYERTILTMSMGHFMDTWQ